MVGRGDSITAQAWPDELMLRTLENGDGTTAVIRKAASGTRILRRYDNITYDSYGLKGETRFPREIQVSGAYAVLIQHGINDIIHPVGTDVNRFRPWSDLPTAEEMIEGLRFYVRTARAAGLQVYMGTLLPIEGWRTYADFREKLRSEVNQWIRTTTEIDGCVDFDRAVCNPAHPTAFADVHAASWFRHLASAGASLFARIRKADPVFLAMPFVLLVLILLFVLRLRYVRRIRRERSRKALEHRRRTYEELVREFTENPKDEKVSIDELLLTIDELQKEEQKNT